MNLINFKVGFWNVGLVIKEVVGLCGKIFNKFFLRLVVDNFNDRKFVIF